MNDLTFKKISQTVVFPLLLAFLVINIISRGTGGTNALSRFATMRSMIDRGSFNIDPIVDWTFDWSQTPDGHYYSNKAPGPMFVALPVFLVVDQFSRFDKKEKKNEQGQRIAPVSSTPQMIVSILTQVLPFLFILFLINRGMTDQASLWGIVAMLFGNTGSLFMNSFFGHGMASLFVILTWFSFRDKKFALMGFFYGMSLLCEYSSGLFFPIWVLLLFLSQGFSWKWIRALVMGGLVPGLLWIWYHVSCFGGPFKLAPHFINPRFQDVGQKGEGIQSIFNSGINWEVMGKLLFGHERGILFTQPWVFIVLIFGTMLLFKKNVDKQDKYLLGLGISAFCLLLIMNSAFGGWHGGHTAGPRYLSMGLLLLALGFSICFQKANQFLKGILLGSLGVTVVHQIIIYGSTVLVPDGQHIWGWPVSEIMNDQTFKLLIKTSVVAVIVLGGIFWSLKNQARTSLASSNSVGIFLKESE